MTAVRRPLTAATVLALACLTALVPAQSASAAGSADGPVWVQGGFGDTLRNLDGTLHTDLGFGTVGPELNAAGDKVAFIREECPDFVTCTESLFVRTNAGDETVYGPFNEHIWSLAWSPDDTEVAFLSTNETSGADTLWRLPLAGTEPVAVTRTTDTHALDFLSEIDWGTAGILFVGSERANPDESFSGVDADQLYTVPASGGAWQGVNQHYTDPCNIGAVCSWSFDHPEYSPDGGTIVVNVEKDISSNDGGSRTRYLATIQPGAKVPTILTDLRSADLGYSEHVGPQWSPDGSKILFDDDDGTGFYTAMITAAGSGRTRLPAALRYASDWQPCPDGVCAAWAVQKLPTKITMSVSTTTSRIKASGTVAPDKTGQAVSLILKKLVRGTWKRVAIARPTLAAGSRYTASWKRPRVEMCSLTARYAGDATHLASSTKLQFYC